MKHLYFTRHGQSEMNVSGHWAGHTDTPLTAHGRKQATAAGKKARKKNMKIDLILSSPLSRAHETAKLIAKEIGYPADKILLHDFLLERNFGEIDGKLFVIDVEEHMRDPFYLDHIVGIETITDLRARAEKTYEFLKALEGESVLVVSHGAFGRALRRVVEGKAIHDYVDHFDNAVIHKLI